MFPCSDSAAEWLSPALTCTMGAGSSTCPGSDSSSVSRPSPPSSLQPNVYTYNARGINTLL